MKIIKYGYFMVKEPVLMVKAFLKEASGNLAEKWLGVNGMEYRFKDSLKFLCPAEHSYYAYNDEEFKVEKEISRKIYLEVRKY